LKGQNETQPLWEAEGASTMPADARRPSTRGRNRAAFINLDTGSDRLKPESDRQAITEQSVSGHVDQVTHAHLTPDTVLMALTAREFEKLVNEVEPSRAMRIRLRCQFRLRRLAELPAFHYTFLGVLILATVLLAVEHDGKRGWEGAHWQLEGCLRLAKYRFLLYRRLKFTNGCVCKLVGLLANFM
jgi:hypothetical protein